jgi:PadR family transcriptional regulator PadR
MMSNDNSDRDLYSGLMRLHILHNAAEEPIFGLGMAEELARHGYKLSPGTLYPLLHGLERKGYLRSSSHRLGKTVRRVYRATPAGRRALIMARKKVHELFGELIEGK